jgi:hypothetical protein
MNEYGLSPLTMIQLLGPVMMVGPLLVWLLLFGPLVIYPIARWKAQRDTYVDTQIGLKVAVHHFRMIALQLLLLGGTLLMFALISKSAGKSSIYRAAFGFLVPGAIVFVAHGALVGRTNDVHFPSVRRLFLGYNLLVTGLIGFIALVIGCQMLFAKGSAGDEGRLALAGVFVYGGAWAASAALFARVVFGDWTAAGRPGNVMPPPAPGFVQPGAPGAASAMPPAADASAGFAGPGASGAAPPQAPPAPSGPSLPPLGGGAFPPIDPNDGKTG